MRKLYRHVLKIVTLLIIVIIGITYTPKIISKINNWATMSVCEEPLTYRIGSIDPNFNVTQDELLAYVERGAKIWETAYGKELFNYDPASDLEINLNYDERQENLLTLEQIEEKVEMQKLTIEEQNAIYDEKLNEIKKKAEELNSEIDYWNSKGGAPEDVYNDLTKKQDELASETRELNNFGETLNKNVDKINQDIENLNNQVGDFNSLLSEKPEIGYYTSGEHKIDVFFYSDEEYLVYTLTHEMGHALGLGHINEPNAVMNPVLSENTTLTDADIKYLNNFCNENNRFDLLKSDFFTLIYRGLSSLGFYQ
jgi:hypothetical protein